MWYNLLIRLNFTIFERYNLTTCFRDVQLIIHFCCYIIYMALLCSCLDIHLKRLESKCFIAEKENFNEAKKSFNLAQYMP